MPWPTARRHQPETSLKGAYLVDIKRIEDERGFFARSWCKNEFSAQGLNVNHVQTNIGYSKKSGTLRGMHFQTGSYQDAKLVRCTRGAVYDVIIDLRKDSVTHKNWIGVELTADNYKMLYVPEGFAHGYITLEDGSEISYLTTQFYQPDFATGVRFNDPVFNIQWPIPVRIVSEKDLSWPDYQAE